MRANPNRCMARGEQTLTNAETVPNVLRGKETPTKHCVLVGF